MEICKEVAEEQGKSLHIVVAASKSMWKFLKKTIQKGELRNVYIPNFGTFGVSPGGHKRHKRSTYVKQKLIKYIAKNFSEDQLKEAGGGPDTYVYDMSALLCEYFGLKVIYDYDNIKPKMDGQ